jgi:HSP20 family molecular chaperone IbpA
MLWPICRFTGRFDVIASIGTALDDCKWKGEKVMTQQLKELLTSVDILNTLHGGVSEPFLSVVEKQEGREIRVRVPGVDRESLKAEINNNELSVYYIIPVESNGNLINMPKVIYRDVLPLSIELKGIEAIYDDEELVIFLPYNRATDGYNKRIITDF